MVQRIAARGCSIPCRIAWRSRSPSPPRTPYPSRWTRACRRHGTSTGQVEQIALARCSGSRSVVGVAAMDPWLGAADRWAYSPVGGQYHRRAMPGGGQVSDDEVLDLREAAVLLGLDERVVAAEAAGGNLPGRRIGGQWRFSRAHLLAWLGGRSGQDDAQPPSGRPALDEEEVDVLLATLPDEPPSPAEQAARDDNDALGDR
jgi:excisionase family DNA binding protein